MFEKIAHYVKNRAFLIGFLSIFGFEGLVIPSPINLFTNAANKSGFSAIKNGYYVGWLIRDGIISPLPSAFYLEEKLSFEWVVTPLNYADATQNNAEKNNDPPASALIVTQDAMLVASGAPVSGQQSKKIKVVMTAYSSHQDETDLTPYLTASGTATRDGVIAANFLPFGTAVKIPELFGDRVFIVEDRMRRRFSKRVDIWMPSKKEALIFGKAVSKIEILN